MTARWCYLVEFQLKDLPCKTWQNQLKQSVATNEVPTVSQEDGGVSVQTAKRAALKAMKETTVFSRKVIYRNIFWVGTKTALVYLEKSLVILNLNYHQTGLTGRELPGLALWDPRMLICAISSVSWQAVSVKEQAPKFGCKALGGFLRKHFSFIPLLSSFPVM